MKIKVDMEDYIEARIKALKLDYLEWAGVDRWDGFDLAMDPSEITKFIKYEDAVIQLEKSIREKYKKESV